jgi:hypothetical protein
MKLRIKGNSIRIRLTKTEVSTLANSGYLQEQTIFPNNKFAYCLQAVDEATGLSAILDNNKITLLVPKTFAADWPGNDVVGLDAKMQLTATESLYLLIEKDFVCLDETHEDQSDNYDNPNKTC